MTNTIEQSLETNVESDVETIIRAADDYERMEFLKSYVEMKRYDLPNIFMSRVPYTTSELLNAIMDVHDESKPITPEHKSVDFIIKDDILYIKNRKDRRAKMTQFEGQKMKLINTGIHINWPTNKANMVDYLSSSISAVFNSQKQKNDIILDYHVHIEYSGVIDGIVSMTSSE